MREKDLTVIAGGDGIPPEPDWSLLYNDVLDVEAARADWGRIVRELRDAGTLSVANGHAIKRLVEFRVQYERAARHVAEHGPVLPAKRAKVGQWNPYWAVMRKADESIRVLEAELGIAPVRRGKAKKVQKKVAPRAADAYITAAARPATG